MKQPGAMRRDSLDGALHLSDDAVVAVPYYNKRADKVHGVPEEASGGIPIASLPGIVVDDSQATLTGDWSNRGSLAPFVGDGYHYAGSGAKAEARFAFRIPAPGKYEVRMAWIGHENRASRALCTIERPGLPALRLRIDQRSDAGNPQGLHSLGVFEFPSGQAALVLSNEDADGTIHADAVQVLDKR